MPTSDFFRRSSVIERAPDLVAAIFSFALYTSVIVPAVRTIVDPVPDVDTPQDQRDALELLSAGNVLTILTLTAIIVMQAGQAWAVSVEKRELARIEAEEREEKKQAAVESKKEK